MKTIITLLMAAVVAISINLGGCSYRNVPEIRKAAPRVMSEQGFEIIADEGFQIGNIFESPGGRVWFALNKKGDSRIRYTCFLTKWGTEYHVYSLKAIDAIAP